MAKILVADDEQKIREVIREYSEFNGHEITEAADGMTAVGLCKLNDFDLIIMDIMMPKLDGFSACKEIKKIKDIPIIMLSARSEEYDKLFGFELGIDDYVVKPFSPKELMARVNAVLARNSSAEKPAEKIMKFDGLEINIPARTVSVDGKKIRSHAEGIRSSFLPRGKQEHRPFQRQTPVRHMGLRLLRRRQDNRYSYQESP